MSAGPKAAKDAKPTSPQTRRYVVLHNSGKEPVQPVWTVLGDADGSTDRQAIANLIGGAANMPQEGTFVAVATRSWRPTSRAVQIVEKAVWS